MDDIPNQIKSIQFNEYDGDGPVTNGKNGERVAGS